MPESPDRRFDLASARRAAAQDETAGCGWATSWAERGSDNEILAATLAQREHWWLGPIRVPVDDLVRLAGPEDDALVPIDDDEWEDDVTSMEESVDEGWEPPPLLAEHRTAASSSRTATTATRRSSGRGSPTPGSSSTSRTRPNGTRCSLGQPAAG